MFPSTGHFRFLPCPFHVEGNCGRVYCHYRHVKNTGHEKVVNDELLELETEICNALKIDRSTFNVLVNEEDENVHEKLVNNKLKSKFPIQGGLLDNFHFPESSDDSEFSSILFRTSNEQMKQKFEQGYDETDESINLTNETSLGEGILTQFLGEDAEQTSNSEHRKTKTTERRHIIVSCLDKIDKRQGSRRPIVQPKANSNASVSRLVTANETEVLDNTDDIATQPLFSNDLSNLKQEPSDSSESEDNAEVDKILSQMELLNPQLFSADKVDPFKNEPTAFEEDENTANNLSSDDTKSQVTQVDQSRDSSTLAENRIGRINLKSIAAINNEFNTVTDRSVRSKPGKLYEPASVVSNHSVPDPIMLAATIAEQNRLKNVFKNTICSNIDQFFDLSDACQVYGTEIFNLLEPLLNYLIERLNPEFNFQKLRQLHSQNMSISSALPFIANCDHSINCVECNNLLSAAMSRNRVRTANKSTETDANNDTPLRKIEAGLYDITKEMLSLGIPSGALKVDKSVQCKRDERSRQHSSHKRSSHRPSDQKTDKKHDSTHKSSDRKHSSSSSKHITHHRSKSSSSSQQKREKRKKADDSEDTSEDERSRRKRMKPSNSEDLRKKKRLSNDRGIDEDAKKLKISSNTRLKEDENSEQDSDTDDIFGEISEETFDEEFAKKSLSSDKVLDSNYKETNLTMMGPTPREPYDLFSTSVNKNKRISRVTNENQAFVHQTYVAPKKDSTTPQDRILLRQNTSATTNKTNILCGEERGRSVKNVKILPLTDFSKYLHAKEFVPRAAMPAPVAPTSAQTYKQGARIAHSSISQELEDIPAHLLPDRPLIDYGKCSRRISLETRQKALNKFYLLFAAKGVESGASSKLALQEEENVFNKTKTENIYKKSIALAHAHVNKTPVPDLVDKAEKYPLHIGGQSIYDLLEKYLLTKDELRLNGYPLLEDSGKCYISPEAYFYTKTSEKQTDGAFKCIRCGSMFRREEHSELADTPSGCHFHPSKWKRKIGHQEYVFECCGRKSACTSVDYHTPDLTDEDNLVGFVPTPARPKKTLNSASKIFALDCEMCFTTVGSELTRVTVVAHDGSLVYDSLVKPKNKITDYNTKFSGITPEKMRTATKTLKDVRNDLFKFIYEDTILVGHGLENDLKALKMVHFRIVDTSVLFPNPRASSRKYKLKALALEKLQRNIQDDAAGHDSKEDAEACIQLVWYKLRQDEKIKKAKKVIGSPQKK